MKPLRSLSVALMTLGIAVSAWAMSVTELPVREINGKRYYYYEAKTKETLYSLSHKLNLTQEEIIAFNPSVYDGVRPGTILYFPMEAFLSPDVKAASGDSAAAQSTGGKKQEAAGKKGVDNAVKHNDADAAAAAPGRTLVHEVVKGETIYGISNRYGITTEQLMDANPATRSGLKSGMTLVIPLSPEAPAEERPKATSAPTQMADAGHSEPSHAESQPKPAAADSVAPLKKESDKTISIALLLPFDLEAEKHDRESQNSLEFYKGFLLAVDTLRNFDRHIHIRTVDIANTEAAFDKALKDPALKEAQVIVAPDERLHRLSRLGEYGRDNGVMVFNLFSVRDDSYLTNPWMMQANVPHDVMYEKALSGFMKHYRHKKPVILKPLGVSADKTEFVDRLTSSLKDEGVEYVTIPYSGSLTADNLDGLADGLDYVFITTPVSQRDLNRLLPVVLEFKEKSAGEVTMFGYPEWITYRGETKENLHKLGATFYSRFIDDPTDRYTKNLMENFKQWYGTEVSGSVPRPGIMGFDAGMYLLRALKAGNGNLRRDTPSYQGVQNGFKFRQAPDGAGWFNERLFLVTYRPTGTIDYQDL